MNESKKVESAGVKVTEQRTDRPQRSYRAPQIHNLGSLEHVQASFTGKYWDNFDRRSWN